MKRRRRHDNLSIAGQVIIKSVIDGGPEKLCRAGPTQGQPMYLRFEPYCRRLQVNLVTSHRIAGKVLQRRLGSLGSVIWSEPVSTVERIRFWTAIDGRFRDLAARHPGVTAADVAKVKD